jgi:hypothetical protein
MQITFEQFTKIVDVRLLHKAGLHAIPNAHKRTVKFYCDVLTIRSACTGDCSRCTLHVKNAVQRMANPKPNKPYGLFTWLMKDASAKRMEEVAAARATKVEVNILGEQRDADAFDLFEEALDAR